MNSAFHSSRCKLIANNVRGHQVAPKGRLSMSKVYKKPTRANKRKKHSK
jgi:hypothetical protein